MITSNIAVSNGTGIKIKRLWLNNQIGYMNACDVAVDLSDYTHVLVAFASSADEDDDNFMTMLDTMVPIDTTVTFQIRDGSYEMPNSGGYPHRLFYVRADHIHFYSGGHGYNSSNFMCVPVEIYGIKMPVES